MMVGNGRQMLDSGTWTFMFNTEYVGVPCREQSLHRPSENIGSNEMSCQEGRQKSLWIGSSVQSLWEDETLDRNKVDFGFLSQGTMTVWNDHRNQFDLFWQPSPRPSHIWMQCSSKVLPGLVWPNVSQSTRSCIKTASLVVFLLSAQCFLRSEMRVYSSLQSLI